MPTVRSRGTSPTDWRPRLHRRFLQLAPTAPARERGEAETTGEQRQRTGERTGLTLASKSTVMVGTNPVNDGVSRL